MKALQINAVYGFGSTGRSTRELHEYFSCHNIESYVACAMYDGKLPANAYKIGCKLDRKLHAFMSRLVDKQGYYSTIATRHLIRYIQTLKPDIVHLNNFHSNYLNIGFLLSYLAERNIATVVTLHDCFSFTGKCFHFVDCHKWKSKGCEKCTGNKHIPPTFGIFDNTHKLFEDKKRYWNAIRKLGVIGVSNWITDCAKESMLSSAKEIKTIYNWIDPSVFYHRSEAQLLNKEKTDGKKIIATCSMSWSRDKGLYDIIDLAQSLGEEYNIILIGRVDKQINLPDNIIAWGRAKSADELACIYSAADVFVNPTVLETFGKVTIEALACGTPAVVYDATACPELIGQGCGAVVPVGDINALIGATMEIVSRKKSSYIHNCINWVKERFVLEKAADEHIKLYQQIMLP